jgi:release factor glutamine methyltransferase
MATIREALTEGARLLREASIGEDLRTASLLLEHILAWDRAKLIARYDEQLSPDTYDDYMTFIRRRTTGEPVQYMTGHQEFYGLDFVVTPDVLIPRPETEFLVEQVIEMARGLDSPLIVDLGTGSGCIAVTVAVNVPRARIIATDISAEALAVARENTVRHRVVSRVEIIQGDRLAALEGRGFEDTIDIIASNPPYVPAGGLESLQREVRDFEPMIALYGGADGLDFYRYLLTDSVKYLKRGGHLVFEIGYNQSEPISTLLDPETWERVALLDDLQGIPRIIAVRRRATDFSL